jgi:phthalate 4,5-dioxygenase
MAQPSKFEVLTRFGTGSPLGELMREYWVPVLLSSSLTPDGAPKRVRVLGEDLVAFRDTFGRVGVLNEACPHRGVSLVLGRNEECGLRCLFHGWKLDITGAVVDAPNETPDFIARIPSSGYPVDEAGGLVWVYLGSAAPAPRRPGLAFTWLPDDHVFVMPGIVHANWLPVIEAGFDQAHVRILHQSAIASTYSGQNMTATMLGSRNTRFEFDRRPYGGTWRFLEQSDACAEQEVRVGEFIMPWWDLIGLSADSADDSAILLTVPVDDQQTMLWAIFYNTDHPLKDDGVGRIFASQCRSPETYRTDLPYDPDGKWGQDRRIMNQHWTGIGVGRGGVGLFYEDIALMESIPRSWDLTQQHLGPSDLLITQLRHLLLRAVDEHRGGTRPLSASYDVSEVVPRFTDSDSRGPAGVGAAAS